MTNKGSGALGPLRRTITVLSAQRCSTPSPAWDRGRCSCARSSPNPFTSVILHSPHRSSPPERWALTPRPKMLLKCVHLFIFVSFLKMYYKIILLLDCLFMRRITHSLSDNRIYSPEYVCFKVWKGQITESCSILC